MKKPIFTYEYFNDEEKLREEIKACESYHTQQVSFSTYHNALTQICFGCKKIRSNLKYTF